MKRKQVLFYLVLLALVWSVVLITFGVIDHQVALYVEARKVQPELVLLEETYQYLKLPGEGEELKKSRHFIWGWYEDYDRFVPAALLQGGEVKFTGLICLSPGLECRFTPPFLSSSGQYTSTGKGEYMFIFVREKEIEEFQAAIEPIYFWRNISLIADNVGCLLYGCRGG